MDKTDGQSDVYTPHPQKKTTWFAEIMERPATESVKKIFVNEVAFITSCKCITIHLADKVFRAQVVSV